MKGELERMPGHIGRGEREVSRKDIEDIQRAKDSFNIALLQ